MLIQHPLRIPLAYPTYQYPFDRPPTPPHLLDECASLPSLLVWKHHGVKSMSARSTYKNQISCTMLWIGDNFGQWETSDICVPATLLIIHPLSKVLVARNPNPIVAVITTPDRPPKHRRPGHPTLLLSHNVR